MKCQDCSGGVAIAPIQQILAIRNNKKPFVYSTAHIDDHFCALGFSGEERGDTIIRCSSQGLRSDLV